MFKVRPFQVLALKPGMGYQLVSKTHRRTFKKSIRIKLIEILETETPMST